MHRRGVYISGVSLTIAHIQRSKYLRKANVPLPCTEAWGLNRLAVERAGVPTVLLQDRNVCRAQLNESPRTQCIKFNHPLVRGESR